MVALGGIESDGDDIFSTCGDGVLGIGDGGDIFGSCGDGVLVSSDGDDIFWYLRWCPCYWTRCGGDGVLGNGVDSGYVCSTGDDSEAFL